jgi:hypothetical protein
MKKLLSILACLGCGAVPPGYAAVLTGSVNVNPPTSVNLTTDGSLDWAIWNTTSSTALASIGATNAKSGEPSLFSAITPYATTAVATNFVRGVGGATQLYSYTDGISPTSQTNSALGFVANSTLATAGRGVQLSITGDPAQVYRVDIWTVGFAGQGEMRASLNGATPVTLLSEIFGTSGTNKASNLFTFEFQPDSVSDLLNVSFHLRANDIGANGHVGIQAITVTAVPEPAALALTLGGLGLVLMRTRARSREC